MRGTSPQRVLAEIDLGDTVPGRTLRAGGKTLVALGEHDRRPVVIKLLLGDDQYWRERFAHEINIYRLFQAYPPPVRAPRLVHTDGRRLLVIERLAGTPLGTQRYTKPVQADRLESALEALISFATWRPPPGGLTPTFNYADRIERYRQGGWFTDTEHAVLREMLAAAGPVVAPNHGDPLPANLLLCSGERCALLDWEFTGLFLPGFDLAMTSVLFAHTPEAYQLIKTAALQAGGNDAAWLINRAVILSREQRMHTQLPPGTLRQHRLSLLAAQWANFRGELRSTG